MTYWLPCSLTLIFFALLAAMPWKHPHPNHLFMLDLLDSEIGGDKTNSQSLSQSRCSAETPARLVRL